MKDERTERGEETNTTCFEVLFISARFPFIAKHRFMELLVFPKENLTFRDPKGSQVGAYVEVYVGAKLELILGPMLEPCWEVFGGQVGAKMASSWLQDGSRWRPR